MSFTETTLSGTVLLQVEGIPQKLQKVESLTMFFENERRSGGGDIRDVMFTSGDKTTAHISFKEPRGNKLS